MKHIVTINDVEYSIYARYSYPEKAIKTEDVLGIKVQIVVEEVKTGRTLKWEEMKNTYLAEKISDYVENTINGQRTFYWQSK